MRECPAGCKVLLWYIVHCCVLHWAFQSREPFLNQAYSYLTSAFVYPEEFYDEDYYLDPLDGSLRERSDYPVCGPRRRTACLQDDLHQRLHLSPNSSDSVSPAVNLRFPPFPH